MKIQESDIHDIRILELCGHLDSEVGDLFSDYLSQSFQNHKKFILNFSGVDCIDRSGLAVLVNIVRNSQQAGVSIKIACLQLIPRKILILTKAVEYFQIYDDMDSAIQSFRS